MPKATSKVWAIKVGTTGVYASEAEALEDLRGLLASGKVALQDVTLIEGYKRELEGEVTTKVENLRVRPVARAAKETPPQVSSRNETSGVVGQQRTGEPGRKRRGAPDLTPLTPAEAAAE